MIDNINKAGHSKPAWYYIYEHETSKEPDKLSAVVVYFNHECGGFIN